MSDYLPNDLWMDVLVKLPIKSIIICTGVCRSWKEMIKSQEFIFKHLNSKLESEAHNSGLLVHTCCKPSRQEIFTIYEENNRPMNILAELSSPFGPGNKNFQIVGSCNGLLCLSDSTRNCYGNVIVWNPLLRRSMNLARPNITCYYCKYNNDAHCFGFSYSSCKHNDHWFGFGYDSVEKEYKVVRIICMENDDIVVEILKLSTRIWEKISYKALGHFNYLINGQVYLHGSLHWIGVVKGNHDNMERNKIVVFDVHEERFHEMEMPETLATYPYKMQVAVYLGSLAIVFEEETNIYIWTMREYGNVESWNGHVCRRFSLIKRPFCGFTNNGEILSVIRNWILCSYDPITKKFNLLRLQGELFGQSCVPLYATPYLESLFFIDKGVEFSDIATAEELTSIKVKGHRLI